jgi:excisionase family DNA binding protein
MSKSKPVFTTGQVAKICQVAPRTVSKWFDTGKLKGYRIPGSLDRRIPRADLIRFLKDNGMPLAGLEQESWHKILVVGADQFFLDRLREELPEEDDYKYKEAQSGFQAGSEAVSFLPNTVIIDLAMGRFEGITIAETLRKGEAFRETLIIALAGEDEMNPESLSDHGFNDAFKKPFDVTLLSEKIRTIVDAKRDRM